MQAAQPLADWWLQARKRIRKEVRRSFDSLVVLTAWTIWLQRNARIFNGSRRSAFQLVSQIGEEASLSAQARFTSMAPIALAFGLPAGRELVQV
jgi:hypothetical protein